MSKPVGYHNPHPRASEVDLASFDYSKYPWQDIKVELGDNGVAIFYIDRPTNLNMFTLAMSQSLIFAFDIFDLDDRVRVVILTGTGSIFCSSAYLTSGFARGGSPTAKQHRDPGGQASLSILRCRKPTIAAINGNGIGIGLTMILSCDLRLISQDAKVAIPFTKRGIAMEAASSYLLPKLIGVTKAMDIILNGDTRTANDPSFRDLWTIAPIPSDQVVPKAIQMAAKLSLNRTSRLDGVEGIASFLEKRKPQFPGKMSDLDGFSFWPWWNQTNVEGKYPPRTFKL